MPEERARNEWSVIISHPGFLELRWLRSTARLRDPDFTATLAWFASETEKARPAGILSDVVELLYQPSDEMMAWRATEVIPRYARAGLRRFAFLVGPGRDARIGHEAIEGPATFPTRWFDDRAQAIGWLLG